jgi:hypothetical protein
MKIMLKNTNSSTKYPAGYMKYNLILTQIGEELLFLTDDGKPIASLSVQTMSDGDDRATQNYWLHFKPMNPPTIDKNFADVFIE